MTTTIGGSYPAVNSDSDATINGLTVGKGGGAVVSNSAFGQGALNNAGTGNYNTAIGFDTLYSNTTGSGGTAVGGYALYSNTTGTANTGIGGFVSTGSIQPALFNNTTGSYNIAVGTGALASNIAGNNNIALGYRSLYNYTASGSTAIGYNSGYSMTSGFISAAVGHSSLYSNTTGASCVAVGYNSLYANTTGSNNVAVGEQALQSNTTASYNTALGYQAGYSQTTGVRNTFIGVTAGYNSTGSYNTFVGSLDSTGGYAAGNAITTGSNNTVLGNYSGNNGGLDIRTASNYIVLSDGSGNPRIIGDNNGGVYLACVAEPSSSRTGWGLTRTGAGIYITQGCSTTANFDHIYFYTSGGLAGNIRTNGTSTTYNSVSDARLKENIVDAPSALSNVNSLKVRSFDWKSTKDHVNYGFIAQELNSVAPEAVSEGIKEEDIWAIDTSMLVPMLTKAIQELKAEVDSLKQQLGK